jgi:sugar (pentulose or hexulose) kinase
VEEYLLGLDLGTTSCKAAVVSHGGREVAHGRARVPWERVATGAEIPPERLVEAALAAAGEALDAAPDGPIGALGVASFAETGILLDARGEPVAPAIAWHDSRGAGSRSRPRSPGTTRAARPRPSG